MKTLRCARCNEKIEDTLWVKKVNGVPIGPHCIKRFYERVRLRQKEGEGGLLVTVCEECRGEYLVRSGNVVCPKERCCVHCIYAHIDDQGEFCLLEKRCGRK